MVAAGILRRPSPSMTPSFVTPSAWLGSRDARVHFCATSKKPRHARGGPVMSANSGIARESASLVAVGTVAARRSARSEKAGTPLQLQPEPKPVPPAEKQGRSWSMNRLATGLAIGFIVSRLANFLTKRILKTKEEPTLSSLLGKRGDAGSNGTEAVAPAAVAPAAAGGRALARPSLHEGSKEALDLIETRSKKYIIVGGKGGVGKTSMSAALAAKFADLGQTTLIVSTDPAHSLSDVFDCDVSGGSPVPVLGIDGLYAQEVNPEESVGDMGSQIGSIPGMEGMGMEELSDLLDTMPPGMDEAIALVQIVRFIEGDPEYSRYERIVFDTAPTGHTLRLLTLPDFLDSFFGKIVSMKNKFSGMMASLKGMFGGDGDDAFDSKSMEEMKQSMREVRDLFRDETQTEFIVATIPNLMAISESQRLVQALRKEAIPVQHVFVNMVQPENLDCLFCSARRKEQQANLLFLRQSFEGMQISPVQFFDREIRGAYGLRAMGEQLLPKAGPAEPRGSAEVESGASQSSPGDVTVS